MCRIISGIISLALVIVLFWYGLSTNGTSNCHQWQNNCCTNQKKSLNSKCIAQCDKAEKVGKKHGEPTAWPKDTCVFQLWDQKKSCGALKCNGEKSLFQKAKAKVSSGLNSVKKTLSKPLKALKDKVKKSLKIALVNELVAEHPEILFQ